MYCDFSDWQNRNYDGILDELLTSLDEMSNTSIYQLFGALQAVVSGFAVGVKYEKGRPHAIRRRYVTDLQKNPRLRALKSCIGGADKTIIFCQYTDEINAIVDLIRASGRSVTPFFGEMSAANRNAAIDSFRGDTQYFVANKSCGAFGLNLQFCHNLIFFSHDWNLSDDFKREVSHLQKDEIKAFFHGKGVTKAKYGKDI